MARRSNSSIRRWRRHLPNFETVTAARRMRLHAANALSRLGWVEADAVRSCNAKARCRNGLCASCVRFLRSRLLDFLHRERLARLGWLFVTTRVEGWTIPAGDTRPFGRLRDHPLIEAFTTRLRRLRRPGIIAFGSVETVYRSVGNVPVGKPFHLHLLVAGVSVDELREIVNDVFPLSGSDVVPLDVVEVPNTSSDFIRVASYVFKQPLAKRSARTSSEKGVVQTPTAFELRELISNLGVHGWTGRLILVGLRCDNGRFRLTAEMSATPRNANSAYGRELPSQAPRRRP